MQKKSSSTMVPQKKIFNDEIKYWKLWRKQLLTKRDFGVKRAKISVSFTIPVRYPTIIEVRREIQNAESKLREVKLNAAEYRDTFLAEQVEFHTK
jgi:hypothetical protein